MSAENPKYWGSDGDEILTCLSIVDYVEQFIDGWDSSSPPPETIDIVGYDTKIVDDDSLPDWFLESFLEHLDDEYGGEEGTDPTETMKAAAKEFVDKIVAEYQVWQCDIVCKKTIKISDYIDKEESDGN